MTQPICVVTGVGPGTGTALARRFTNGGYQVAMLARNAQRLGELSQALPGSRPYPCDVSDPSQVEATAKAIARDLGPKGVHVAYLVIDAVIDVPWARERYKDKPDDLFIQPAAIADEIWHVAHQDRCAWSFNVELRPYRENW
jgi:NAD(P)-dependent dehydrogenase (short-subunit alcohol dehydrogenase family)